MTLDFAAVLADRLDPPEPDVFGKLGYVPTPKQAEFHAATEHSVLFGGSTGGGKSRALTAEAIRACVRYPGIRVGAFRRSYPELRESLLAELAKLEYAAPLGGRWNGTEHELRIGGSLIMFRYAETLADATRRQGGEYQLLILDELTLFPPDVVTFLESRVRSGRADIPVLGVRASANPGGTGHGAVKARYIKPTNYGERVVTDERGRTVRLIRSRLSDNPHMNPEHASDLLALTGQMREAFLEGNWDVFAGQMFPELKRDRHVVEPFSPPPTWRRYVGVDWGHSAPWAVGWFAVDEDGRVWMYREIYETGVGEAEQARRILAAEAEGEQITARYADDAMWGARGGDVKTLAAVYQDNGCRLTPAGKGPGSRVTGWQRLRSYLAEAPACPLHRSMGQETCPMLHVFSTCINWFTELSSLPRATKGDPEDSDPKAADHMGDMTRYVLLNIDGGSAGRWIRWARRQAAAITDAPAALEAEPTAARLALERLAGAGELVKCRKPDCMRQVPPASAYCCRSCSTAAEAPAPYELGPYDPAAPASHWLLAHTRDCEDHAAERGELVLAAPDPDPAAVLRQARNAALRAGRGTWQ